jgi:hypothetical protein
MHAVLSRVVMTWFAILGGPYGIHEKIPSEGPANDEHYLFQAFI